MNKSGFRENMMIEISKLSSQYEIRPLGEVDTETILELYKGNPQSSHFWSKNGYRVIREVDKDGWGILLEAEKRL